MDEPKAIPFFQIVEEVIKNGNSDPDYLQKLDIFSSDFSNLTKCKEILDNEENNIYIRTFASQAILKLTHLNISNWKIDFAINLCDWSIEHMLKNCMRLEKIIFASLSNLVAFIFEYFWKMSNTDCMNEWNEIIQIFDNKPSEWVPALFLISSINDRFIDSKEKIDELFAKNCLPTSFVLAYNCVKKIRNSTHSYLEVILDMSLDIVERCIYKKIEVKDLHGITYEDQITFYFEIYNGFQNFSALKCLYAIVCTIYVLGPHDRPTIIERLCIGFMNILNDKINDISCDHLNYILTINAQLASYLCYSVISQMKEPKNIENFIRMMADLTNILIQQKQNLIIVRNAISFWEKIEAALRNDGDVGPKKLISNAYAPQLCINYINYLLDIQNFNIKKGESSDPNYFHNDILEITENMKIMKLSQYIFPVQNFVILNPKEICPKILVGLKEKQKEFVSNIESSTDITVSEAQLAFFVEVATAIILIKKSCNYRDPKISYHPDFFANIISLLRNSAGWARNNFFFPRLEMSLILFINQVKNTLFGSRSSEDLYKQLKKKCSISSYDQCQSFLFDRSIATLRFFNEHSLISQTLSFIKNNKINPSKETLDTIFSAPFDQYFPFINRVENKHLRSLFFSTIFSMINNTKNFSYYNNQLLIQLDSKFKSISESNDLENNEIKKEICYLAIDICGIFNGAIDSNSFRPIFEWFISNDRSKLFETSFPYFLNGNENDNENNNDTPNDLSNDDVVNSILKMWNSIVLCTPPTRIVFEHTSPNGVIMFKMAAILLTQFSIHINSIPKIEELPEPKIKGIKYMLLILQNLVSGMYVPFYAFKIYNDNIFTDLLNAIEAMINEPFVKLIEQYPKVFNQMIHFFREITVNQIETVIETSSSLVKAILNCSIKLLTNGENDDESIKKIYQWTLDIILAFLQHIYEFSLDYKPFQSQIDTINFLLWDKVLKEKININVSIADPLKYLYLLNKQFLFTIKEKISSNLPNHKKNQIDEFFSSLEYCFELNDLQATNIKEASEYIHNIVDIMH